MIPGWDIADWEKRVIEGVAGSQPQSPNVGGVHCSRHRHRSFRVFGRTFYFGTHK